MRYHATIVSWTTVCNRPYQMAFENSNIYLLICFHRTLQKYNEKQSCKFVKHERLPWILCYESFILFSSKNFIILSRMMPPINLQPLRLVIVPPWRRKVFSRGHSLDRRPLHHRWWSHCYIVSNQFLKGFKLLLRIMVFVSFFIRSQPAWILFSLMKVTKPTQLEALRSKISRTDVTLTEIRRQY